LVIELAEEMHLILGATELMELVSAVIELG